MRGQVTKKREKLSERILRELRELNKNIRKNFTHNTRGKFKRLQEYLSD